MQQTQQPQRLLLLLNNNLLQFHLPESLVYKFANSTLVGYGQLDSDDQEMVLRCTVCLCLISNQTNFLLFYIYVKSCVIDYLMTISVQTNKIDLTCLVRILGSNEYSPRVLAH